MYLYLRPDYSFGNRHPSHWTESGPAMVTDLTNVSAFVGANADLEFNIGLPRCIRPYSRLRTGEYATAGAAARAAGSQIIALMLGSTSSSALP
jgi:hypothetical protein